MELRHMRKLQAIAEVERAEVERVDAERRTVEAPK
jgi:hypothetical protein